MEGSLVDTNPNRTYADAVREMGGDPKLALLGMGARPGSEPPASPSPLVPGGDQPLTAAISPMPAIRTPHIRDSFFGKEGTGTKLVKFLGDFSTYWGAAQGQP
jgi:hypothetical protein